MAVTRVNRTGISGLGTLLYSGLIDEQRLNVYDQIYNDIVSVDALVKTGDEGSPYYAAQFTTFQFVTYLLVTDGLDIAPFTSAPELKYKVGSWGHSSGKRIVSDGGFYYGVPYDYHPEFIVYPQQVLDAATGLIVLPDVTSLDYEIDMTSEPFYNPADCEILTNETFGAILGSKRRADSVAINLNPGITASVKIFYRFYSYPVYPTDPFDLVGSILV
jgi:hypothetical protein